MSQTKKNNPSVQETVSPSIEESEDLKTPAHADCEEQVKSLTQELAESKSRYLRALADFKNLEERVRRERIEMKDMLLEQFVVELLPVLDHLDMAGIFSKDPGLQMVAKLFADTLKRMGLQEVALLNTDYDPHTAEAIEVIEGKPDGKVVEVALKGYQMNNRTIRPGKVKVGRTHQS